ncbi:hypothetical protein [Dyadobacter sp. OTU695]|uniref:hypothetical protein n=1 Tax=Dyadobacter sp. OTU695 TaxID=3043860 RepID=UPI00313CF425
MKDSERISNLEEMTADIYLVLDRIDNDLNKIRLLDINMANDIRSVASVAARTKRQQQIYEMKHAKLHRTLLDVFAIARKNAINIENYARNTLAKDDLSLLYEYMMRKFDLAKEHTDRLEAALAKHRGKTKKLDDSIEAIKRKLDNL